MAQTITPYLLYEDCEAMLDWLARAFGFREVLRHRSPEGSVWHAEMELDGATIYMGDPGDEYRNPRRLGGVTQSLFVLVDDVDAHYDRARAAGAEVTDEPADKEYGFRQYGVHDPEGHAWFFAKWTRQVAPDEWGAEVAAR
jgi:PhnB protein